MSKPKDPESLRPIGARALKSAGDTLRPFLSGMRVLDLYAGQGRFAQMVLHEQAASVVCVERERHLAKALEALAQQGDATVQCSDVFRLLARCKDQFDLVFADPPFEEWSPKFEMKLLQAITPRLSPGAFLLVKNPSRVVISGALPGLKPWKQTRFGESSLTYFRYEALE